MRSEMDDEGRDDEYDRKKRQRRGYGDERREDDEMN